MSFEEKIVADLYHDLYQRAMPNSDDEIFTRIRKLQSRLTRRALDSAKAARLARQSKAKSKKSAPAKSG